MSFDIIIHGIRPIVSLQIVRLLSPLFFKVINIVSDEYHLKKFPSNFLPNLLNEQS